LVQGNTSTVAASHTLGFDWRLLEAGLPSGVPLYLLDCPALYARSGGPYQAADGHDWEDNGVRFGLLCRVAADLAREASPLDWRPDVLHCNDWPAGLAPAFPHAARTVMTVHNLAFQGNFDAGLVEKLGLPPQAYSLEGLEFYGRMSFLKAGLAYADAITTVSPSYAREIQTEELGCGLHGLLQRRRDALEGILNGIDTAVWDPATDAHLPFRYDRDSLELKKKNKAALQARMGLEPDPAIPLIGMVGRFTHQKGIDLAAAAATALAALPAQMAVLGKGEREHENAMLSRAAQHPGRVAVAIGFSEDLAHAIEAGADLFLMPSRFEPCGLNQMYSQRYGTPPVARATGGLRDSIADGESGFLFERAESGALLEAMRRAVSAYRDAPRWRAIQRAAMARDFSWESAARRYADLYLRLASPVRA
jgi:starch synthase